MTDPSPITLRTVVIADYDPTWPARYEAEKAVLLASVGGHVEAIEHIGSTSVPGLGAKPIIDLMIGLRDLADATACLEPIQALGYEYVPAFETEMPFRRYFRKDVDGTRTHQIHMVATSHSFWERHLLFRDYLRAHPDAANDYERLKRELAAQHRHDLGAYTDAKTEFIEAIVARAKEARRVTDKS